MLFGIIVNSNIFNLNHAKSHYSDDNDDSSDFTSREPYLSDYSPTVEGNGEEAPAHGWDHGHQGGPHEDPEDGQGHDTLADGQPIYKRGQTRNEACTQPERQSRGLHPLCQRKPAAEQDQDAPRHAHPHGFPA